MASSAKKKPSKKPANPKAQKTKTAPSKASAAREVPNRPRRLRTRQRSNRRKTPKPRSKKLPERPQGNEKISKANGARKAEPVIGATFLGTRNHKEKRLDPFTRSQKEKLLQLRDAMVDSMAGVAKDNLRSRAEGSEASAFGMHQADAGSDAYDRDFALSLLSQEQDALYEIDQALKRIELGTYGTCEMSGKSISHARLEAIPLRVSPWNASRSSRSKTKLRACGNPSRRSSA